MRAPDYFEHRDGVSQALSPLASLYSTITRLRQRWTKPWQASVPIICVGNVTAGGAGKTPVAVALGTLLRERKHEIHFLSRGYGGHLRGPTLVDRNQHTAHDVGDEPLLLAEVAPTWIARNRTAGAKAAIAAGASAIVMDDGLQNPTVAKTMSLVVVDGGSGFGNGRVLPAGPLREPLCEGLSRADAFILFEPDTSNVTALLQKGSQPTVRARMVPAAAAEQFAGRSVVAFAGIGRPEKFFATLEEFGCRIVTKQGFPDHHTFTPDEIMRLVETARAADATPVTTAKDYVRLSRDSQVMVEPFPVLVEWRNPQEIESLLNRVLLGSV
ncbi:MAG: tetraacyldisaccharide 4'-kinase [Pseudomonadota bacterium]|jgi:tetraacyldisaccharide 4'-kinase|nr:tetraacyldisaccharide 4'-kinase [Pseudomonadota bacterium]